MDTERKEKHQAIKAELISLRAKLKNEHQAVTDLLAKYNALCATAAGGDEEAAREAASLHSLAEQSKAKIDGFQILISKCEADKAQLEKVIFAEFERQRRETERVTRAAEHAQLVLLCRAAREHLEVANSEVVKLNEAVGPTYAAEHEAQVRLGRHLDDKPDPNSFPSKKELAIYAENTRQFEEALHVAQENCRTLNLQKENARRRGIEALAEFNRLAARERLLRPAELAATTA